MEFLDHILKNKNSAKFVGWMFVLAPVVHWFTFDYEIYEEASLFTWDRFILLLQIVPTFMAIFGFIFLVVAYSKKGSD